jgi:hypothetical protein
MDGKMFRPAFRAFQQLRTPIYWENPSNVLEAVALIGTLAIFLPKKG